MQYETISSCSRVPNIAHDQDNNLQNDNNTRNESVANTRGVRSISDIICDTLPRTGLSIMHLNIQAITNKLDEIKMIVNDITNSRQKQNIIFGITESHLNRNWSDNEMQIEDFVCFRKDRVRSGGGGILAYAPNSLEIRRRIDLETAQSCIIETMCLEVVFRISSPIIICFLYRPPSVSVIWREELNDLMKIFENEHNEIILLGDFNINTLHKSQYRPLKLIMTTFQFKQLIENITRPKSGTIIDHIYTSHPQSVLSKGVIETGLSDHHLIYITRKINPKVCKKLKHQTIKYRDCRNLNTNQYIMDLSQVPWNLLEIYTDPNDFLQKWTEMYFNILNTHAPQITKRVKSKRLCKWLKKDIRNYIKMREMFLKQAKKSKSHDDWLIYKHYRNKVVHEISESKSKYYTNALNDNITNPKLLWKIFKEIAPAESNISTEFLIVNNVKYTNHYEISNIFNNYFINIINEIKEQIPTFQTDFTKLELFVDGRLPENIKFNIPCITEQKVANLLRNLDTNKATGLDGIDAFFVKMGSSALVKSITSLCNLSISSGIFPTVWKKARVSPSHKGESINERSNFRPLSILSILSKILERHVFDSSYGFLQQYRLLNENQHGFRKSHSCETLLLSLYESLITNINKGEINGLILLDFSKAFDLVDHDLLLKKLEIYHFGQNTINWFHSYLSERSQRVQFKTSLSDTLQINSGVPQGSILGPLLFIIFINDLSLLQNNSMSFNFADDSTLMVSSSSTDCINTDLNHDIGLVSEWVNGNLMTLNFKKTKSMKIYSKRKFNDPDLLITKANNQAIEEVNSFKLLGVHIDSQLQWEDHISNVFQIINKRLFLLKRIRHNLPLHSCVMFYNALINPHLLYCCTVWGNASNERLNDLLKLQKRAARIILQTSCETPSVILFHELKWIPIVNLIKMRKLLLVFNVLKNKAPYHLFNLFEFINETHNVRTRSSLTNLKIPLVTTEVAKTKISYTGAMLFNSLPNNMKDIDNISPQSFKNFLKTYFLDLNCNVSHLEELYCRNCIHKIVCTCTR